MLSIGDQVEVTCGGHEPVQIGDIGRINSPPIPGINGRYYYLVAFPTLETHIEEECLTRIQQNSLRKRNIYQPVWQNLLNDKILDLTTDEPKTIDLSAKLFEDIGNRKKTGYGFKLEIHDGRVATNIKNNAVARDFARAASQDENFIRHAEGKKIRVEMDDAFSLHIKWF